MAGIIIAGWLGLAEAGPFDEDVEIGARFLEEGQYEPATARFLQALRNSGERHGLGAPETTTLLSDLSDLYWDEGRFAESEGLYLGWIAYLERSVGAEHASLAQPLSFLSTLYALEGRYPEARFAYEKSVEMLETESKLTQERMGMAAYNLAAIYEFNGQARDAQLLYERSLEIWSPALDPDNPNLIAARQKLGMIPAASAAGEVAPDLPIAEAPVAVGEPVAAGEPFAAGAGEVKQMVVVAAETTPVTVVPIGAIPAQEATASDAELASAKLLASVPAGVGANVPDASEIRKMANAGTETAGRAVPSASDNPVEEDVAAEEEVALDADIVTAAGGGARALVPPPTAAPATPAPSDGAYFAHVASSLSQDGNEPTAAIAQHWVDLRQRYPSILADMAVTSRRADLGPERGIYYRLLAGPTSKELATAVCDRLAEDDIWCMTLKP